MSAALPAIRQRIAAGKKKKPYYVMPAEPATPQEAYNEYAPLMPWQAEAGEAAQGAATRLGSRNGGLLALLRKRAEEGLAAGGELSAEEMRAAGQNGLASWSARGMGRSPGAGFSAMLNRIAASNARRREREGFAAQVAGMEHEQDLATLGVGAETAYKGLEFGEDIRRFGIKREDTQAQNETNFGLDLYTGKRNSDAAADAAKSSTTGAVIGGVGAVAGALIVF